jgi:hypothetical protein
MPHNRYNSRVSVTFHDILPEITDIVEYFDDLQMAYLRIVQYLQENPNDWNNLEAFTQFANKLDQDQITGVSSSTMQIIVEYA